MRIVLNESGVEYAKKDAPQIRTPSDAAAQYPEASAMEQEGFVVMMLNAKNRLISADLVTVGILDASLVHPREIFRTAIAKNAAAIILAHNHPSGDPSPSAEDIRITRKLIDAGNILDIKVLDHVIIGETIYSMREAGALQF